MGNPATAALRCDRREQVFPAGGRADRTTDDRESVYPHKHALAWQNRATYIAATVIGEGGPHKGWAGRKWDGRAGIS